MSPDKTAVIRAVVGALVVALTGGVVGAGTKSQAVAIARDVGIQAEREAVDRAALAVRVAVQEAVRHELRPMQADLDKLDGRVTTLTHIVNVIATTTPTAAVQPRTGP